MASTLRHVTGIDTISGVLQGLPRKMRAEILGVAVDAGAEPMVVSAKQHARRSIRTGALYLSIGKRVKKYEDSATAVAIVGPQRARFLGRRKLGKGDSAAGSESPTHYAHLIEFGHHAVKPRKGTSLRKNTAVASAKKTWVSARPFMRPAFLKSKPQVAAAVARGVSAGVEKARAQLVKTGAHVA